MKKLLLIFSLILGIIAAPVFAEDEKSILIDTFPTNYSVSVGNTFGVNVAVGSDYSNTTFYYIFYGGPDENLDVIETKSQDFSTNINFTDDNLNCHNLPTFTVDEIGNGYLRSNYAYIPPNYPSGIYSLYVSFFFPDCSNINTLISFPRSISVIGVDPTPSLVPTSTPTPTNTFPSTPSLATTSTPTPTPTPSPPFNSTPTTPTSATTFQQSIPTKIPTPTIDPKKFGILKSIPIISITPTSEDISNIVDPNIVTIQTGSNPLKPSEVPKIQKTKFITNLGAKVFFIFLLVSVSFTLYCLCFFGYTLETLLPEINQLLFQIKTQSIKVFFILKRLSKIIYQYFQNLFKVIKTFLKNSKVIQKDLNFISQKLFIFLKICLKISQKIKKYIDYFFRQFFIIIKDHIKTPRRIKRYLIHKKYHFLILIYFSFIFSFFTKSVFATTDSITSSQNWVVPDGVNSIVVEAWGGGGAGGGLSANRVAGRGGGGAGGQYVIKTLTVTPGTTYPIIIGNGAVGSASSGVDGSDTTFNTAVVAKGGAGGQSYDSGTWLAGVGTTAGGIGDTVYAGGSGSDGGTGTGAGGAGGGGAGSTGSGGNASGNTAGVGTTYYGGAGGDGLTLSNGNPGNTYGGGGGAGASTVTNKTTDLNGGSGANGYMRITYTVNQPPSDPTLTSPTNSAIGVSTSPTLILVTTDPEGNPLQYKIILGTDAAFVGTTQVFNQTVSNVGWSAQNVGTSAYSSGTTASYIIQTSLSFATMYYWKAQAIDYSGSLGWGNLSVGFSFTTYLPSTAPVIPTLVSPSDSATNQSLTPTFKTVTTDANSDNVQYELKICTDSGMSANCQTFDQTSSNVGWSGQDVGTSAYATGTTATYILQVGNSLAENTTYFWKTRAIDYAGTGNWSTTQTTPYSFTTIVPPNLNQATFRWRSDDLVETIPGSITFSTGVTYVDVGNYPTGLTSADLNNDGKLDLVTSNYVGQNITVLLATGFGTYGVGVTYKAGPGATYTAAADLNKDGNLDLITTTIGNNMMYVYTNNGNGTFGVGVSYPARGTTPQSVVAADINKDGDIDLITANSDSNNITVFTNNGSGVFGVGTTYSSVAANPLNMGAADLDLDGNIDLISANYTSSTITVYKNTGSGTFSVGVTYPTLGNGPHDLAIADFNNDGKPDAMIININSDNMTVFTNTGTGTFGTGVTYPTLADSPYSGTAGDINNDGWVDIVADNMYGNKITVYTNDGDGTFSVGVTFPTAGLTGKSDCLNIADINGDGKLDLATADIGTYDLTIYTNTSTFYDSATWLAAENVGITDVNINSNIRLRFSVANTGVNISANYRLQVAPKGGSTNCTDVVSGNFSDVTTTVGSNLAVMTTSLNFTNQQATTNLLIGSGTTFIAGKMVEYNSNQTDSISLNTNEFTEVEYNFQMTNNVGATTPYCFRVVNVDTTLNTYTNVAQLTTIAPTPPFIPTLVSPSDSATNQSLTPTFKTVTTDANDDNLQYELKICTDSGMSANCQTFDQTASNIGWSGQDVGTSAYSSGTTATYILQVGNSLAENTTYFWKTRSIDYAGTATWSSTQTTPYSFTTISPNLTQASFRWRLDNGGEDIGSSTFATGTTYPTLGAGPNSVTFADVNNDGKPDLISANRTGNNITVFNNNGNGTFATGTTYPTIGTQPFSVTSTDVNGDGKPDLVTANSTSNNITVFTNNGNGTFATGTTYPTLGATPNSVTSADVNNDGKPDLISANWNGNNITVFNNNGNGTFATGTTYPTIGTQPRSVTSADVNGDGLPDLVSANNTGNNITVFNNNGNGTFATGTTYPTIGITPYSVTSADVNGDGLPDLVSANGGGNNITVFNNNGNGTFVTGTTYPTLGSLPISVTSADVNGDGLSDLVTANYTSHNITVFNNNGNGTFATGTTYPTLGTGPQSVTSADVNGDGKPDLVSANYTSNNITVFTNIYEISPDVSPQNIGITSVSPNSNIRLRFSIANTDRTISSNFRLQVAPEGGSTNCTDVASGNFTDVGTTVGSNLAVMTTSPNFTNQQSTTHQLSNLSTFATGTTYPTLGTNPWSVTSTDVNGDGKPDLISANYTDNNITVFTNNGNGTFGTGTTYPTRGINPYSVTSADVNGDGQPDLVSANASSNNITVFNNNGNGTFGTGTTYPTRGANPISVTSADVNNDGKSDLVSANYTGSNITVFNNNGNGTFGTGTTYPTRGANPYSVTSADVNGDGKSDLITANYTGNNITVFTNNGNGTFATGTTYPTIGITPRSVTSADVNNDGKPDLVSANGSSNNITVFTNNGNGTFATGTTYPTIGITPYSVTSADVNGDGLPDLVSANGSNNITVFTNNSNGTFATGTTYPTLGSTPVSVTSADVNNDGKSDLVSANYFGNNITVFTNNGNGTFVAGKMVEYNSNQSDSITLSTNEFTEVEYNFQMTSNVGATTLYCFRVNNIGATLNTYTNVAQLTTVYFEGNVDPLAPYLPYVNNIAAQSGQQTPVYGLTDHTPAFSAVFDDPNTSNTAASYQLQIGSDSDWASAEIWDSTKTAVSGTCNENSRCADIVYSGGTSLVDGSTYYWRLKYWNNSDVGSSWSDTQQFSMNSAPSVSDVTINGNNNINLSENSSIGISWIATVTDTDSYTNLSSATGKIYRSGVGQSCTPNNNNCYTDTSCDFINCADDHCTALCSANLYFFTESTAIGSTYVDQYYQAWIEATDLRSEVGSSISTSTTIDVNNLSAFRIGESLVYGEVFAGSDTGSSNTVTTVTNTGNSLINLEITGDYMCTDYPSCGGQSIEPHYQEYNLNTFTYGAGETLSIDPTIINIGISKPTQTPSNSFKNLYWGIGIPSVKPPGNYQGAVTILVD